MVFRALAADPIFPGVSGSTSIKEIFLALILTATIEISWHNHSICGSLFGATRVHAFSKTFITSETRSESSTVCCSPVIIFLRFRVFA
jgi:hypothetical protein